MSYSYQYQCSTNINNRKLSHMFIIPFPVLCKCRNQLKRTKTTKVVNKDDIKRQRRHKNDKVDIKKQRRHKKEKTT